ncbi:hypothetical protein ABD76_27875 [Paenibacillus dendritiformis]|nr:hypothetical protein [Paenibacillus dendritiformis]
MSERRAGRAEQHAQFSSCGERPRGTFAVRENPAAWGLCGAACAYAEQHALMPFSMRLCRSAWGLCRSACAYAVQHGAYAVQHALMPFSMGLMRCSMRLCRSAYAG